MLQNLSGISNSFDIKKKIKKKKLRQHTNLFNKFYCINKKKTKMLNVKCGGNQIEWQNIIQR